MNSEEEKNAFVPRSRRRQTAQAPEQELSVQQAPAQGKEIPLPKAPAVRKAEKPAAKKPQPAEEPERPGFFRRYLDSLKIIEEIPEDEEETPAVKPEPKRKAQKPAAEEEDFDTVDETAEEAPKKRAFRRNKPQTEEPADDAETDAGDADADEDADEGVKKRSPILARFRRQKSEDFDMANADDTNEDDDSDYFTDDEPEDKPSAIGRIREWGSKVIHRNKSDEEDEEEDDGEEAEEAQDAPAEQPAAEPAPVSVPLPQGMQRRGVIEEYTEETEDEPAAQEQPVSEPAPEPENVQPAEVQSEPTLAQPAPHGRRARHSAKAPEAAPAMPETADAPAQTTAMPVETPAAPVETTVEAAETPKAAEEPEMSLADFAAIYRSADLNGKRDILLKQWKQEFRKSVRIPASEEEMQELTTIVSEILVRCENTAQLSGCWESLDELLGRYTFALIAMNGYQELLSSVRAAGGAIFAPDGKDEPEDVPADVPAENEPAAQPPERLPAADVPAKTEEEPIAAKAQETVPQEDADDMPEIDEKKPGFLSKIKNIRFGRKDNADDEETDEDMLPPEEEKEESKLRVFGRKVADRWERLTSHGKVYDESDKDDGSDYYADAEEEYPVSVEQPEAPADGATASVETLKDYVPAQPAPVPAAAQPVLDEPAAQPVPENIWAAETQPAPASPEIAPDQEVSAETLLAQARDIYNPEDPEYRSDRPRYFANYSRKAD